jgi:mono/diheme cytochrome c family protein
LTNDEKSSNLFRLFYLKITTGFKIEHTYKSFMTSSKSGKVLRSLAFFFLFLSIFASLSRADTEPGTTSVGEIDGRVLYVQWCSQCHGLEGRGDGPNSTPDQMINVRDHTDPIFMSTRSDRQLEASIRDGGTRVGKSPIMPPWRATLSDGEINALVSYLRELCKCKYGGIISDEKIRKVVPDFR